MNMDAVNRLVPGKEPGAVPLERARPLLEIRDASKRFVAPDGREVVALDDVSISVGRNEFVTLLGPSGCGKTTLLRVVSGFEDLDAGVILIDGQDMARWPAYRRPVNTVFQSYALFPHMSVTGNVGYSLEVSRVGQGEIRKRVGEMLELVGLAGFGDRRINQLSGGQQQRVALARALVARPKLLLLDEPLSALDKNLRAKMQQELKALQHELGISFVFVTHDQEEALTMSDRIAVLGDGRLQQMGSPQELYRQPRNVFVARFVGESNLFQATVTQVSGSNCSFRLADGQEVRLPNRSGLKLARGDRVKLLARPEDARLGPSTPTQGVGFSCNVREAFFVGTHYKLVLDAGQPQPLKVTVQAPEEPSQHPVPGEAVELWFPASRLHPLPAEEALS